MKIQFFDVDGGHRLIQLAYTVFFSYHVPILCYSIDNPDSFIALKDIYCENKEHLKPFARPILLGLKSDLERYRSVSSEEVDDFARLSGAIPFEMSTRTRIGFKELKDLLFVLADEIIAEPPKPPAPERNSTCSTQ